MIIAIDVSQTAYEKTGVANYVRHLVEELERIDEKNQYILFFSSLRKDFQFSNFHFPSKPKNVKVKTFKFPPLLLDILWNRLHIFPIEWFVGDIDVFISSDWTQPPTKKAKKVTVLYDLIVYRYPDETDHRIVETQKRRLNWVKKECDKILCISDATKRDAMNILQIGEERLVVTKPGIS